MAKFVLRLIALVFLMKAAFAALDVANIPGICLDLGAACCFFGLSFDTRQLRVNVSDLNNRDASTAWPSASS